MDLHRDAIYGTTYNIRYHVVGIIRHGNGWESACTISVNEMKTTEVADCAFFRALINIQPFLCPDIPDLHRTMGQNYKGYSSSGAAHHFEISSSFTKSSMVKINAGVEREFKPKEDLEIKLKLQFTLSWGRSTKESYTTTIHIEDSYYVECFLCSNGDIIEKSGELFGLTHPFFWFYYDDK